MPFDSSVLEGQLKDVIRLPQEPKLQFFERQKAACKDLVIDYIKLITEKDYQDNCKFFLSHAEIKQIPDFVDQIIPLIEILNCCKSWDEVSTYLRSREQTPCIAYLYMCADVIGNRPDFMILFKQKINQLTTCGKLIKARNQLFNFITHLFSTIVTDQDFGNISRKLNAMYARYMELVDPLKQDGNYGAFIHQFSITARRLIKG